MAPSIACKNKKTKRNWFMVSLLMNSPHFSTQVLTSGIPHIVLPNISAEKQHQADREFAMRVAFDVTGFILLKLSRTIAQRFSMGDRSWDVDISYTLRPKVREVVLAPPLGLGGGVS